MSLLTMGTAATTTLKAMKFSFTANPSDMAALEAYVLDDQTPGSGTPLGWGSSVGAVNYNSAQLFIPNRGVLTPIPGDFIVVDTQTGFPFLISAAAAAAAGWVHS